MINEVKFSTYRFSILYNKKKRCNIILSFVIKCFFIQETIGHWETLSDIDIQQVNLHYNCPAG